MAVNVKLGDKTYTGVETVKLNTVDGGTAEFVSVDSVNTSNTFKATATVIGELCKNVYATTMADLSALEATATASGELTE